MNKEKQNILPELRFPEFENDKEWVIETLSSIAENLNNKRIPITSNVREKGDIPYYGATGVIDYVKDFIFDEELLLISEDGANLLDRNHPIAYSISGKTWVNNHAHVLKFENKSTEILVQKYINSNSIEEYLTGKAQPKLNRRNLERIRIPLAKNPNEQQKIANCLSSLDEIIYSETEKLDLLQDHKKGLLQQLFPQEGETQPQYRFPEFENDGDWEVSALNKISSSIFDGTHQTPKYTKKGIPFFSVENLISGRKNKYISREDYLYETRNNKPEFGDVLITRIGNIGTPKVVDWEYEFSIYVTLAVVKKSEKFDSYYLQAYIQSSRFQKEIIRRSLLKATPCKINMDELRKCEILLPSNKKEQQKIANCISTADELIESQIHKIKALKKHNKGLMQQLFPNVNSLVI